MALRKHQLIVLGLALLSLGAAPSRDNTYVSGTIIDPSKVTANEDTIYNYLQAGVDTYRSGTVNSTAITDGTILNIDIASTAAIAYSKLSLTGSIVAGDFSTGAVDTTAILNGTVTATDLNATLTPADGALINLSSINVSSTAEGLLLPQASSCSSGTAEGQICWDTDDALFVGTGSTAQGIGSLGTPALTLGTANSAGTANTVVRTDATLLVFDATAPTTQAFGDAAATGSAAIAARRDHKHAMPSSEWTTVETLTLSGSSTASSAFAAGVKKILLVLNNVATDGGAGVDIVLQVNAATSGYTTTTLNGATFAVHSRTDYMVISAGAITVNGFITINTAGEGGAEAWGDLNPFNSAKLWRGTIGATPTSITIQSRDGSNQNGTLSGTIDVYSSLSLH